MMKLSLSKSKSHINTNLEFFSHPIFYTSLLSLLFHSLFFLEVYALIWCTNIIFLLVLWLLFDFLNRLQ